MVRKQIEAILDKVQNSTSCHQKYVLLLTDIYKKTPREEFFSVFKTMLRIIMQQSVENSVYTNCVLAFLSSFCSDVTKIEVQEAETHDFLTSVLKELFHFCSLAKYEIRYNSCCFIAMLLQDIGEKVQLEVEVIDEMQDVLLERMQESKVSIRIATMSALVRLQDPDNFDCPVINAYKDVLCCSNPNIRKDAVQYIAPNMKTIPQIVERIRDVAPCVREAAFKKCAIMGPLLFKIADKQQILLCGFKETNSKVKDAFYGCLLPKWLTAYEGKYLKFMGALKLIVFEEDNKKLTYLCKELIKAFFKKEHILALIETLPINDEKLIKINDLSTEVTLLWAILVELFRGTENMDHHLNNILPELTPFCHYIERIVTTKSLENMDEWKYLEYQFDLLNLFEIAENYDYSDEVGRRTMHALTMKVLQSYNFKLSKLIKKLVSLAYKCSSKIEFFTTDMCHIISEIREPLTDEPLSEKEQRERDIKAAGLRVKLNVLQEQQDEAVGQRDYQRAQSLDHKLVELKKQLEELQSQTSNEKVRVVKSDVKTLCYCLDILISVLELPGLTKLTTSLNTCKDQYLIPSIGHPSHDVHSRIIKCLALFSVLDEQAAKTYAKLVSVPILAYRTVPAHPLILMVSISGVTELIIKYGIEIVGGEESSPDSTSDQNLTKRKLYSTDNDAEKVSKVTISYFFEIFLDMLDDEGDEIKYKAVVAISVLIKYFPVTPTILSRILLKWFSPLTERQESRLQVFLGLMINQYMKNKSSGEIMKEAIVPTLTSVAQAPRTSPLADIDIDNLLMFLSEMMNVTQSQDNLKILALDICLRISENGNDKISLYFAKLLNHLDLNQINSNEITEVFQRIEVLNEETTDKTIKRYLEKVTSKIRHKNISPETVESRNETTANTEESMDISDDVSVDKENDIMKKPQHIKRRKSRNSKSCVVVLERLNFSGISRDATLHTIQEMSFEMEVDNVNGTIEIPTTDSKSSSQSNSVIISETSDSDFSQDNEVTGKKRSSRCRKKRILLDL